VSVATNKIASGFMAMISTIGQRIATIGQQIITSAIKIVPELASKLGQALPVIISLIGDYLKLALLTMTEKSGEFTGGFSSLFGGMIDAVKNTFATLVD
jgi:phage-related protein